VKHVKRAIAACAAVIAIAAGCGSSPGSGTDDPAKLAPAGTIAYASFELNPQGAEKADFDAAFGKLLGSDPSTRLKKGFADAIKEMGSKLDYQADVEPWLGDRVAAVVTGVRAGGPDFALLVASKDDDKARAAIEKDLAGRNAEKREYKGKDYRLLDGETANGVVDGFLVAGTEAAFKSVVDAAGGSSLADTDAWKQSVGDRAAGKVGLAWFDLKAAVGSVSSQLPGAQRLAAPLLLGLVNLHPFVATLDANADSLVVDVASPGTPADKRGVQAASSELIEQLPADSWFAFALPGVGKSLQKVVDTLRLNPLIAGQYRQVTRKLRIETGLDLEGQVLAGIGNVGGFVRGGSPRTVGGALVVGAADSKALATTIATLPPLIARDRSLRVSRHGGGFDVTSKKMPKPVQVRIGADRAAAAYGASNTRAALTPNTTLGGTDLFRKATASIGGRPTVFATFAGIASLARSSPHKLEHHNAAEVQRTLAHLEYAAVGARREGKLDVLRAVLGLR
jgi:hypothetical protein